MWMSFIVAHFLTQKARANIYNKYTDSDLNKNFSMTNARLQKAVLTLFTLTQRRILLHLQHNTP